MPTTTQHHPLTDGLRGADVHQLIIEHAREYAILMTDPQGAITTWSRGAELVFGWSAAEALTLCMDDLFSEEDRAVGIAEAERRVATAGGVAAEVRWYRRRDGRPVFIDGVTRALRDDDGTVRGFIKMGLDITERRLAEDALRGALRSAERSQAEAERARGDVEQLVAVRTAALRESNEALAVEVAEHALAHEAHTTLRRQLSAAEEEERRRIARELHDGLGQHLAAFSLMLAELESLVESVPLAGRRIVALRAIAATMQSDARGIALALRPPELDDVGLGSALDTYVSDWSNRYHVLADVATDPVAVDQLTAEGATTVYRLVQEGLTNVARHAAAGQVSVILEHTVGAVRLIIEDDGCGFEVPATLVQATHDRRLGLAGMRERVGLLGGSMRVESSPGQGATLFFEIPA